MANEFKYEIILYWSGEDQAFIAKVPELPGCAADGETYQEALTNVQQIIIEWIDRARELGRPIPSPQSESWQVFREELDRRLAMADAHPSAWEPWEVVRERLRRGEQ